MMIFRITGVDGKGVDRTLLVKAEDERHAIAAAKAKGIHPFRAERDTAAEKAELHKLQAAEAEERASREGAEAEERTGRGPAEKEDRPKSRVEAALEDLRQRLRHGHRVFLYDAVYLPVDAAAPDEPPGAGFDIGPLHRLGVDGWEVVQAVPRTAGPEDAAAAPAGDNVAGVHVLLKKEITQRDVGPHPAEDIVAYVRSHLI